jgi:aspartate racemase
MYKMFRMLADGRTDDLIQYLAEAVQKLEKVGADFAVMSANTPHIVYEQVKQNVKVPMISIVEETYSKVHELGLEQIGLLGTKFTMENDFFKKPFIDHYKGIVVPNQVEQDYIHEKIVEELENGIVNLETKQRFIDIINAMVSREDIQGVILGCTELPLLIQSQDLNIPVLNTTEIHVNKIVDLIFEDEWSL